MLLKIAKKVYRTVRYYGSKKYWLIKWYGFNIVKNFSLEYFSGKRVAIIGPADSALNEKLGSYIDNFDIVIRINKSVENLNMHHEFIGTKTTVLFHGLDETPKSGCGTIETRKWKNVGIKKVFYPLNEKRFQNNFENYLIKNKRVLPIYQVDKEFYNQMRLKVNNYTPTTGFTALYILLHSQCSELYISGFTFFKTPHQGGYRSEIKDHSEVLKMIKDYGNHNPDIEFEVFKGLIQDSTLNIKLDKTLNKLIYGS